MSSLPTNLILQAITEAQKFSEEEIDPSHHLREQLLACYNQREISGNHIACACILAYLMARALLPVNPNEVLETAKFLLRSKTIRIPTTQKGIDTLRRFVDTEKRRHEN
jgi:hypothetical protein